jgi:hypothetical protein
MVAQNPVSAILISFFQKNLTVRQNLKEHGSIACSQLWENTSTSSVKALHVGL